MKLRTIAVFGAGVAAGVVLARRLFADDPEIVRGPLAAQASTGSAPMRIVADRAERLAEAASAASLAVIRRARGAIRERLRDLEASGGVDEVA
jgi:hypothetical protein